MGGARVKVKVQLKLIHDWVEIDVHENADPTEIAVTALEYGAAKAEYEGAIIDFEDENMESIAILLKDEEVGDGC
jgi:hypothetical protein